MKQATYTAPLWVVAACVLAGCAGPVAAYHDIEGGAIAQARQAPPGADQPYPNLAGVPTKPTPPTEQEIEAVGARLTPAPASAWPPPPRFPVRSAASAPIPALVANPAALEGLTLPGAAPPPPNVPGSYVPAVPAPHVITYAAPPKPAPVAKPVDSTPVSLAFAPDSAILDGKTDDALATLAGTRGDATMLVGGFGRPGAGPDATALQLAVERARAIADALTAAGVPTGDVTMVAAADGAGGFVQLVY
jgi:outer membrane protein OmpA-like peptidoglycan-associated protein